MRRDILLGNTPDCGFARIELTVAVSVKNSSEAEVHGKCFASESIRLEPEDGVRDWNGTKWNGSLIASYFATTFRWSLSFS